MATKVPVRKCAVYTRKSSEEGLQQEFNSLDAQREAGIAFVRSQAGEGWRLVETCYDDGGISGGTLERPALRRLLDDIGAGKIHVVVVYKVDRLTRSLSDFAKLIEVFEANGVSFVSVTQQFNTTTSMGRLMLNVLLSFAQFEREVTGERIRDKIAASKKKGMWMGGTPAIGYEVRERKLVVVEKDAELVRHIFRRYVEIGCITLLARELVHDGHLTRCFTSAAGKSFGRKAFSRGHLHRILSNRLYLGEVVHQGASYPGQHDGIVSAELWSCVESMLSGNRNGRRGPASGESTGILRGKVFDDKGNPMGPVQTRKSARRYRYYVSRAVSEQRREDAGSVPRVPAQPLEAAVLAAVRDALSLGRRSAEWKRALMDATEGDRSALLVVPIRRVVVGSDRLHVTVQRDSWPDPTVIDAEEEETTESGAESETVEIPFQLERRGGSVHVLLADGATATSPAPDASLIKAVVRGHDWARRLLNGEAKSLVDLAREAGVTTRYVSRLVRYAFLAPDITEAILSGNQPVRLTVGSLQDSFPLEWSEQRRMFGLAERP